MTLAVDRAKAAIARGDLITAYDETVSAIGEGDMSAAIRHQQVLALARMGDTERAMELFGAYGLDRSDDPHQQAVGARLLKDRALGIAPGPDRDNALGAAFEAYRTIFAESGDPYPGINAASLAALGGRNADARAIAIDILAHPEVADPGDYYMAATCAEALLILGRVDEGADALRRAGTMIGDDHGARSTTCRQLKLLARHMGLDDDRVDHLLAAVRPPCVIHYCGHMFAADPVAEAGIRAAIDRRLADGNIGFAYGALAAGGDILIAEAIVARGGELHVVLPFAIDEFIGQSVRPAGEQWIERFEHCMAAASSRTLATEMAFVGDPDQFAYGSRVAMGLATLRAQHLGNVPQQLAVWDGVPSHGSAGTGADVAVWRIRGGETIVIDPGDVDRGLVRPPVQDGAAHERALAAILFTDFPGFSKLAEAVLPAFWGDVMRRIADVLNEHGEDVLCRNSWGDALYAVASSAAGAAEIALTLQSRLREFDYRTLGLADSGGMRIGAHYGPAYRSLDPITGRMNFYGTEVSRAARIEPVTPPGAVFVTEPFAAILALEAPGHFQCRYVGRIALAKGYGTYPMYRLTRLSDCPGR
ncbi:MAG TPA: tetratricopeptide repeat-containing protein [Sphingobium sp.]|uniref:tetratricopeptide repeat-containing protein n=1 Tax=Sphingobium sp. TaxID=1912891 RepID=UPI002ED1EFA6